MSRLFLYLSLWLLACNTQPQPAARQQAGEMEQQEEQPAAFQYPLLPEHAPDLQAYIPQKWVLLDSVSAQLNDDAYPDYVLVLETADTVSFFQRWGDSAGEETDKARMLLIVSGMGSGGYRLSGQSTTAVLTSQQGGVMGDPYQGLSVENKSVCLHFFGGSRDKWNLTHCYANEGGQWLLQTAEASGGRADRSYNSSYNLREGAFSYSYLEEEHLEELDSIRVISSEDYRKHIPMDSLIRMESFAPWSLLVDEKIYF